MWWSYPQRLVVIDSRGDDCDEVRDNCSGLYMKAVLPRAEDFLISVSAFTSVSTSSHLQPLKTSTSEQYQVLHSVNTHQTHLDTASTTSHQHASRFPSILTES
jgi:hypothetical protein